MEIAKNGFAVILIGRKIAGVFRSFGSELRSDPKNLIRIMPA